MALALSGVALITGAGSGIGEECTFSFTESGVSAVVLADINDKAATAVAEKCKPLAVNPHFKTFVLHVDVANESSVDEMVKKAVAEFGRIDYFVHMAGIVHGPPVPTADASLHDFEELWQVNVKGTLICNRAVASAMLKQENKTVTGRGGERDIGKGAIVNIASALSFVAFPGLTHATSANHAILGATRNTGICNILTNTATMALLKSAASANTWFIALDHAAQGVRVNIVCPIWTDTPFVDKVTARKPNNQSVVESVVPLKRIAKPEEVASAILYLCSPGASYIQGQSIVLDGGGTLS
ncbi:MAG: putative secondary metabolism biosynthetic enzyme [Alyxoria varia]|nr:MAG: putative secondary metabolism biosynthetic enzyme [Alyxoria varia]